MLGTIKLVIIMLKEYRLNKNMTQEELEEKTGLDRKTIFRIENDINVPLIDTFGKIAIALELSNDEIANEIKKSIKKGKK